MESWVHMGEVSWNLDHLLHCLLSYHRSLTPHVLTLVPLWLSYRLRWDRCERPCGVHSQP
jgi:hypothetical protein